jgi:predicted MPP superfamily phosphohydrolase
VRSTFFTLLLTMAFGDILWWGHAHLLLRRAPPKWRLLRRLHHGVMAAALCGLAYFFAQRSGLLGTLPPLPRPAEVLVYLWHLLMLPVALAFSAGLACAALFKKIRHRHPARDADSTQPESIPRREFLRVATGAFPSLAALGGTGYGLLQLEQFRVRELVLELPQLPQPLDGFSIAHISDLHVGRLTRGKILERIVSTANDLRADLAVFTGDLVNYSLEDLPAGLDVLRSIRTTHGTYAVEGNHDLFLDPVRFRRETSRALPLLLDESQILPVRDAKLQILGMRWRSDAHGQTDPHDPLATSVSTLESQLAPDAFPVLLAHHPHIFDHFPKAALTLAGHTHGGQLMLHPRVGMGPVAFRYWSGLYKNAGRALIVSNGIGNWFPIRTQAPAEIVRILLKKTGSPA